MIWPVRGVLEAVPMKSVWGSSIFLRVGVGRVSEGLLGRQIYPCVQSYRTFPHPHFLCALFFLSLLNIFVYQHSYKCANKLFFQGDETESCYKGSQKLLTQASDKLFSGSGKGSLGRITEPHDSGAWKAEKHWKGGARQWSHIVLHLNLSLIAVWPQTSEIITPTLSFLICKMGVQLLCEIPPFDAAVANCLQNSFFLMCRKPSIHPPGWDQMSMNILLFTKYFRFSPLPNTL